MILNTERLVLRNPTPADADMYLAFCNSEFVLRYNAMTPRSRQQVLEAFSGEDRENTLLLELRESGRVIGAVFTEEDSIRWDVQSLELSYFMDPAFARQGYMREALRSLVAHLFTNTDTECVAARCFAPNTASRRLLQSLGFHQDGLIPRCVRGYGGVIFDDTLHSLLKKEWETQ